jgi:hypothetical protein
VIEPLFLVCAGIIGLVIPAAFYAGTRAGHSTAEASIEWLRAELNEANDRLFAASREPGVTIPPRSEAVEPVPELPVELERLISDWESAEVQDGLRAQFMGMLQEGLSIAEIRRRHLES